MAIPPKPKGTITPPLQNKVWCSFDSNGCITYIDWEYTELLRERYIQGQQRDVATSTALLMVGVRELVLQRLLPD